MFIHPDRDHRDRRGATLILTSLLMILLIGMIAFGVEVGRMYLVRSQLQTAVDAGALAAALELRKDDENIDGATAAAQTFVAANRVGWLVTVPEEAIVIEPGQWDTAARTFEAGPTKPNAVRVSARQDNEPFFFAGVFGRRSFGIPRRAIAAGNSQRLDIMMVLDLSGSMGSDGRIEALQAAAPEFVNVIEQYGDDDQIGVMGYGVVQDEFDPARHGSGSPYLDAPSSLYPPDSYWVGVLEGELTGNFDQLRNSVLTTSNLVDAKYGGGTPIGAALRDGAHYLVNSPKAREDVEKVIVLMSDGRANKPSDDASEYALKMAAYAQSQDIKVYTISLGDSADVELMQAIAAATEAKHFDATGSGQTELTQKLITAFRHVAQALVYTSLVD